MRKNIKTCIYAVTAILPVILSACSNKADDTNTPKSVKEGTTTFVEDISSDIVSTTVETTTEEDTTELISETEQEVINSTENITEQQQTQAEVQQTTIITSFNPTPTPAPITTTPRPTETTTPRPTETITTPVMIEPEFDPNKVLLKDIKGIGEKYSYKGKEFKIDEVAYTDVSHLSFSIDISVSDSFTRSQLPFEMYCRYDIYNSNETCVKTGYFKFICDVYHMPNETTNPSSSSIYLKDYCNSAFDIYDLPGGEYTIVFSNYE